MSATLGGLIKDYRLQKKLSQMEVSFAMGWKEPSRLSRIEQGRVGKPPRKLIDKIIKTLNLTEEDKNYLLLIGNYLPTEEEIEKIRKETDPIIKNWPYPAYMVDYSWRFIHWNQPTAKVYLIDKRNAVQIMKTFPRTLELVFSPDFIQNKYLNGKDLQKWHEFLLKKLILFKYAQKNRTKEKWYIDLVKDMMSNKLFQRLWQKAQIPKETKLLHSYERKSLVNVKR